MSLCFGRKQWTKGSVCVETFNKIKPPIKSDKFGLKGVDNSGRMEINKHLNNLRSSQSPVPNNSSEFYRFMEGQLSPYSQQQILKSEYQELLERFKNQDKKWTDQNFPAKDKSWRPETSSKVIWKRVHQIIKDPQFVSDSFTPFDILQGQIGNCYFLSAIAGLSEKPYRIKKIFPNLDLNKNGIYMARLLHKGIYQEIVVDDYFPCSESGQLLGAQPAGGVEIWVMILEKCWAKLFGSYDAIDGGLPNEVLHAFSAAPTQNYCVASYRDNLDQLFEKMLEADQKDHIVCCGTESQNCQGRLQKVGLVGGHAYTILGVYESPLRMLKIRNPWGSMEWSGTANDNDAKFWSRISEEEKMNLGYSNKNDGTFFMLWQDFQQFFVIVDICWINDNANYFYRESKFQKGKPRYFDLDTIGGQLTIALSQPGKRQLISKGDNKTKLAHTTLLIGRQVKDKQYEYVLSKSGQSCSELYIKLRDIEKGRYMICAFAEGDHDVNATVSVYSGGNFSLIESDKNRENQDFLSKVYLDHARKNQAGRQILTQQPLQWVTFDLLTDSCGFGYSAFHLDPKSTRKLGLEFDQKEYTDNGMELLPPHRGTKTIKVVCSPGQDVIVLCRMLPGIYMAQFMMPVPKMCRLISA